MSIYDEIREFLTEEGFYSSNTTFYDKFKMFISVTSSNVYIYEVGGDNREITKFRRVHFNPTTDTIKDVVEKYKEMIKDFQLTD